MPTLTDKYTRLSSEPICRTERLTRKNRIFGVLEMGVLYQLLKRLGGEAQTSGLMQRIAWSGSAVQVHMVHTLEANIHVLSFSLSISKVVALCVQ